MIFINAGLSPWLYTTDPDTTLGQKLLAILLWFTTDIELLLLHSVADSTNPSYAELCHVMRRISWALHENPMPKLSTLYIQRQIVEEPEVGSMDIILSPAFYRMLNITRLHLWRNTKYFTFTFGPHGFLIRGIKELKLVGAILAEDLMLILREALQLETLSVIVSHEKSEIRRASDPQADRDINDALILRRHTLKELEFRMCGHWWYLPQFGPDSRLTCLPQLENLERLAAEAPLIMRYTSRQQATDVLPPNLISLTMVDEWRFDAWNFGFPREDFKIAKSPWIALVLAETLAALPADKMRNFKRVHYLCDRQVPHFTPLQMGWIAEDFQKLTTVEFSWGVDEMPLEFFPGYGNRAIHHHVFSQKTRALM
ncbi:hypothetical protein F4818DRAFT_61042 [Hypoxylon cercidicola]|nr:hypothetical protein F4818DRAFT_61042 [Hypoxylon cercidicola]